MDILQNSSTETEDFNPGVSDNIKKSNREKCHKSGDRKNASEPSDDDTDPEDPSDEEEEEDVDPNTTYLHFREIPKDAVHRDHVVAILGPESAKSEDAIILKTAEVERAKTELRSWANEHIKRMFLSNAKEFNLKIKGKKPVNSFLDIKKWWRNCSRDDKKAIQVLNYIQYGWFKENKRWEVKLERLYMKENHLKYSRSSKAAAQKNCQKPGVKLKGCIALTISYVKCDVVKQVQTVGKKSKHGMSITKSRPADMIRNPEGKYVKRKPDDFCIIIHSDEEESVDEDSEESVVDENKVKSTDDYGLFS